MQLSKSNWTIDDGKEFICYLESIKKEDSIEWTRKIFNTECDLLAIPVPTLRNIAKEIAKGDYLSFLQLHLYDYIECFIINACLIVKVTDLSLRKAFLLDYLSRADSWVDTDTLKPLDLKKNNDWWWNLGYELRASNNTFTRRYGVVMLLSFASDSSRADSIIDILSSFTDEEEYYVNMALAWVICEMMIKQRDKAIKLFDNNALPPFVINKAISKCRDSYRVSPQDKEFLLQFRK